MAKSLEKSAVNFVSSTTKAVQNYKEDLMKRKNIKTKYAVEQAKKYGC